MPKELPLDIFNTLSDEAKELFINNNGVIKYPPSNTLVKQMGSVDSQQEVISSSSTVDSNAPKETVDVNPSITISPSASPFVDGFNIVSPVALLMLLDDELTFEEVVPPGKYRLHPWQIQFMMDFSRKDWSDDKPFHAVVRAANGSGKDKICIAACAVWICMRYRETTCPTTSSSGFQLNNQTCKHISRLCKSANVKWCEGREEVWKINTRYFKCIPTDSDIPCYATDEPGKAEGFHPTAIDRKMAIFMSEDKSIPDEIDNAIDRCSGYTHRVHASSPGNAFGHFYDMCQRAPLREEIDIENAPDLIQYHIPASKCSHIKPHQYRLAESKDPNGTKGAFYNSTINAEFAVDYSDLVVLPFTYVYIAKKLQDDKWIKESHNKAGLDLSDGGAETVLVVRNGNKVIGIDAFKFDNTEDTIDYLHKRFSFWELIYDDSYIFGDCVGMGKPILNRLRRMGWNNIRFIDSRHRPYNPTTYKNYGTELWFNFASYCKRKEIIIPNDETLGKQLATRYYKLVDGKIHQLLSKPEQRSKGYPSPDRADATVYAFADYKSAYKDAEYDESIIKKVNSDKHTNRLEEKEEVFTLRKWAKEEDKDRKYGIERIKQQDFQRVLSGIQQWNNNRLANKQ